MKTRLALSALIVLALAASVFAQAPATVGGPGTPDNLVGTLPAGEKAPPALTDVQKLTIQNLALSIEIAQLRSQQAQRDFDAAREQLGKLIQSLQVEGFTLDLSKLEYTKKQPAAPAEAPVKK